MMNEKVQLNPIGSLTFWEMVVLGTIVKLGGPLAVHDWKNVKSYLQYKGCLPSQVDLERRYADLLSYYQQEYGVAYVCVGYSCEGRGLAEAERLGKTMIPTECQGSCASRCSLSVR